MKLSLPEQVELLIAGYVLGDLDADEATEFEQILAGDPAIAEEVGRMQRVLELSYLPAETSPPASLRSTILAEKDASNLTGTAPTAAQPTLGIIRSAWNRRLAMAAAALIVALGISNYQLWQTLQESQVEQPQTNALVYSLQGTEQAAQASATVVVDPEQLEGVLNVENLPPLPPGKVYVLWTVIGKETAYPTDEKGAILTQVFSVGSEGSALQKITVPQIYRSGELVARVAVTLEDATAPERHVGPIMMITGS